MSHYQSAGYRVLAPQRDELDLADTPAVDSYLRAHHVDIVLLAAVNIDSLSDNVRMYLNVARCSPHFGRLITVGSGAEYDRRHYVPHLSENAFGDHVPADTYGLSKYIISNDIDANGKDMVNLRVFGIFGPHEDYQRRFISNNICRAIAGLDICMNRGMRFDFIDVRDFLAASQSLFSGPIRHRNYNLCTGRGIEFAELAAIIHRVSGSEQPIRVLNDGHGGEYSGDNTRFTREFGPLDLTSFESSIESLYLWYRSRPDIDAISTQLRTLESRP